jgi:hypothetical protein
VFSVDRHVLRDLHQKFLLFLLYLILEHDHAGPLGILEHFLLVKLFDLLSSLVDLDTIIILHVQDRTILVLLRQNLAHVKICLGLEHRLKNIDNLILEL